MKKAILVLALTLCMLSLANVGADNRTPGDDLIETAFSGVVTDAETGDPVVSAQVYGFDDDFNEYRSTRTNSEGAYYLEFNRGGHYTLYVDHDEYEQGSADATVEMNDKTVIDFELVPKVFDTRIFGTVTDAETGSPLPDVMVQFSEMVETDNGGYWNFIGYEITDSEGKYSYELFEGTFWVTFHMEGYDTYSEEVVLEANEEYELDTSLEQWARGVYGRVTNENGDPMADVVVALETGGRRTVEFSDTTDENGEYEIRVPRGGEYTLKAFEDGYRPYNEDINIPDDSLVEQNIQLTRAILPDPLLRILYAILELLGII